MPDVLKISLWVGLAAVVLGVACLGAVAWINAGSRNLVLATSTLVAAIFLFATQLPFELRSRTDTDVFAAELTVDRATPQIRLWKYPEWPGINAARLTLEAHASSYLVEHERARFDGDRERLNVDLILYSVVAFLGKEQFDWQLKRTASSGATFGSEVRTQRVSRNDECTAFSPTDLNEMLLASGNSFGHVPLQLTGGMLCLPPKSTVQIGSRVLMIQTPYCTITFTAEPSGSVAYVEPGTGGNLPHLKNGDPQYETRLTGIRSAVEFSWIRAQDRQMQKYVEWSERLVKGARLWFEGRSEHTTSS